jgi:plastocyanin
MKKFISTKRRFLISITFAFAILSILNSCSKPMDNMTNTGGGGGNGGGGGGGGASGPGTNEVWIQGMAYNPAIITVSAGTTITWTNKDASDHTVTSTTGLFDSGTISVTGTWSHLFSTPGTYTYLCSIHSSMTATVIVN